MGHVDIKERKQVHDPNTAVTGPRGRTGSAEPRHVTAVDPADDRGTTHPADERDLARPDGPGPGTTEEPGMSGSR